MRRGETAARHLGVGLVQPQFLKDALQGLKRIEGSPPGETRPPFRSANGEEGTNVLWEGGGKRNGGGRETGIILGECGSLGVGDVDGEVEIDRTAGEGRDEQAAGRRGVEGWGSD